MAAKEPKTPDELLNLINSSSKDAPKETVDGTVYNPELNIEIPPPRVETIVNGFVTPIAKDVFLMTGSREAAERTDDLVYLFGNNPEHKFDTRPKGDKTALVEVGLYDRIKTAALCHGHEDEAFWLRQNLWLILEKEEGDLTGAEERRVKERDDDANQEDNVRIARYLGASALGRIRLVAANAGVSNRSALQAIVLNFLKAQRTL